MAKRPHLHLRAMSASGGKGLSISSPRGKLQLTSLGTTTPPSMFHHYLICDPPDPPKGVPNSAWDAYTVGRGHLSHVRWKRHGRHTRAHAYRDYKAVVPSVGRHQPVHHDACQQPSCSPRHDEELNVKSVTTLFGVQPVLRGDLRDHRIRQFH